MDSGGQDAEEDNDDLGLSLPAAKTLSESGERLQICKDYMLEKQKGFRDNWNYSKLEKRYNIVPSLHLHQ